MKKSLSHRKVRKFLKGVSSNNAPEEIYSPLLKNKIDVYQRLKNIGAKNNENFELQDKLSGIHETLADVRTRLDLREEEFHSIKQAIGELSGKVTQAISNKSDKKHDELKVKQKKLENIETQISHFEHKLASLVHKYGENELVHIRGRIGDLKEKYESVLREESPEPLEASFEESDPFLTSEEEERIFKTKKVLEETDLFIGEPDIDVRKEINEMREEVQSQSVSLDPPDLTIEGDSGPELPLPLPNFLRERKRKDKREELKPPKKPQSRDFLGKIRKMVGI